MAEAHSALVAEPTPEDEIGGVREVLRWLVRASGLHRQVIEEFALCCDQSVARMISAPDFELRLPEIRSTFAAKLLIDECLSDADSFANIAAAAKAAPGSEGAH